MRKLKATLGVITARGGSRGIPGKNLRRLAGKPLIAHTIEAALKAEALDRVIVSTDDDEIAQVCEAWGVAAPFRRPPELATDLSAHLDALLHAVDWLESQAGERYEYVVTLQPTCPLRTADDIDEAVRLAHSRDADAVVGVCPSPVHPCLAQHLDAEGVMTPFAPAGMDYLRRQDLPPVYVINGAVYVNRIASLARERTMFPAGALAYIMPESRSFDIDTPLDLAMCEFLLQETDALERPRR